MEINKLLYPTLILISIIFVRIIFDIINQIEIHFDEAQYWVWSQNLSLSYLSKGPLVPTSIAISNAVFGKSYLGLKFFSFAAYLGTILMLSMSASKLSGKKESFHNALLLAGFSPALFILGGVASTDIFLFFFWSLTIFCYICFFKDRNKKWFYFMGISIGLGILAKLTMILLPLSILLYFLISDLRKYFLQIHIYLSAIITILISLPILIWNAQNNWVTFFHEVDHLISETPTLNPEILLVTLILTAPSFLLLFNYSIRRKFLSQKFNYLIYPTLIMIVFFVIKSFTGKIQINWSIPIFLALIPILVSISNDFKKRAVFLSILILSPILLLSNNKISSLISEYDPLHPTRGWDETYRDLFQDQKYDYLAAENYKLLSTAAYFHGDAEKLFLTKGSNRRLTHYDLWKKDLKSSDKILFISQSSNEMLTNTLNCKKIREVTNSHRKHLTLYNCTSK